MMALSITMHLIAGLVGGGGGRERFGHVYLCLLIRLKYWILFVIFSVGVVTVVDAKHCMEVSGSCAVLLPTHSVALHVKQL